MLVGILRRPAARMMVGAEVMGVADGPTEVHKITLARQVLKGYQPVEGLWPSAHVPSKRAAARERLAARLELEAAEL